MGKWPHCPNDHGPLEPTIDVTFNSKPTDDGDVIDSFRCPDCEYTLDR